MNFWNPKLGGARKSLAIAIFVSFSPCPEQSCQNFTTLPETSLVMLPTRVQILVDDPERRTALVHLCCGVNNDCNFPNLGERPFYHQLYVSELLGPDDIDHWVALACSPFPVSEPEPSWSGSVGWRRHHTIRFVRAKNWRMRRDSGHRMRRERVQLRTPAVFHFVLIGRVCSTVPRHHRHVPSVECIPDWDAVGSEGFSFFAV